MFVLCVGVFQYVAVVVTFQLLSTSVTFREQPNVPEILKIQMIDLSTKISQRPGAQAIRWVSALLIQLHLITDVCCLTKEKPWWPIWHDCSCRVEAGLQHWYVTGLQQSGAVPSLIASVGDSSSSLLRVVFELNPEESTADQLLRVHSQPVEVIYDAVNHLFSRPQIRSLLICMGFISLSVLLTTNIVDRTNNELQMQAGFVSHISVNVSFFVLQLTVNSMVEFFKTGKGVDLEVLTTATLSKLEEIKEKTASGHFHQYFLQVLSNVGSIVMEILVGPTKWSRNNHPSASACSTSWACSWWYNDHFSCEESSHC